MDSDLFEQLWPIFSEEAHELLQTLANNLIALERDAHAVNTPKVLEALLRGAHSLKGSAHSVGHHSVATVCQTLESVISGIQKQQIPLSPELFNTCQWVVDRLGEFVAYKPVAGGQGSPRAAAIEVSQRLEDILAKRPSPALPVTNSPSTTPQTVISVIAPVAATPTETPNVKLVETVSIVAPILKKVPLPASTLISPTQTEDNPVTALEQFHSNTVRMATHKLDHLLRQIEETLICRQVVGQRLAELKEMRQLAKNSKNQPQEGLQELHARLEQCCTAAESDQHMVGLQIDSLLASMKQLLMQPFGPFLAMFPKIARDTGAHCGKEVEMHLGGGDIEVDRRILDMIKDPVTHLLRNSIDHGMEMPDERVAQGKPRIGNITLQALQVSGSHVTIEFIDDGRGIDIPALQAAAVATGHFSSEDIANKNLLELLCLPGVSTRKEVSSLSGRGMGMNIIAEKIQALGGELSVTTTSGMGTTFRMTLPMTLATFRGVRVRIAEYEFFLPTSNVERVLLLSQDEVKTIENRQTIVYQGHVLALCRLGTLLGVKEENKESSSSIQVVIVRGRDNMAAFIVDSVEKEQEVFAKALGTHLQHVRFIAAATVLDNNQVVSILDPLDLVHAAISGLLSDIRASTLPSVTGIAKKKFTILVAEDSQISRILLKSILEGGGYQVITASDGLQALSCLQTQPVDLLLTDIEMPHFDGIALIRRLREQGKWAQLPVIVCSANALDADRKRGLEVGANAYIDKGSFTPASLLIAVQSLI